MSKEKEKSEKGNARRTLFVRNLPYSTSDDQLSSVFVKYGAIKSCFTVKDKGVIDQCKGYGYVLFEKREDAERAKREVKKVKGRVVQIVFADKRPMKDDRKEKKMRSKVKPETELIDGIESESDDSEEGDSDNEPSEAVTSGNNTQSNSSHRKTKSERSDPRYDVGRVVVVTGVPENMYRSKLRKKCSKYGPLEDFVYPVATEGAETEGVNGLIAHVTYKKHPDARKATKALEGLIKLGGDIINPLQAVLMSKEGKAPSKATLVKSRLIVRNVSFDVTSDDLQKLFGRYGNIHEVHIPRKPNGQMRGFAFVQFMSYFEAAKALEGVNGMMIKGRQVAVDWVVAKPHYEASLQDTMTTETTAGDVTVATEMAEGEGSEEGVREEGGEVSGSESEGADESEGSLGDDVGSGSEDGMEYGNEIKQNKEETEVEKKKTFEPDVHKGTTVFIRNLPFQSGDTDLHEFFSQFGRVRYARIVLDKHTRLSRGSAFVQFIDPASVQHCLQTSGESLLFNGRMLDVTLALSPRELSAIKECGEEKSDKRNLYLSKEGNVQSGSEAAQGLSKTELAKRLKAQAEKKTKLSNPNFYVSRTRLSVRNIPTQTTESQLKEIFSNAINSGTIKQLKILRSKDRFDAEGVGRSKGFAFAEFSTHESALTALRAINNNPSIFPNKKRLMVEFAVEDARIMQAREQRKTRRESKATASVRGQEGGQMSGQGGAEGVEVKRKNKKVEWQLKCREQRLRKRERETGNGEKINKTKNDRIEISTEHEIKSERRRKDGVKRVKLDEKLVEKDGTLRPQNSHSIKTGRHGDRGVDGKKRKRGERDGDSEVELVKRRKNGVISDQQRVKLTKKQSRKERKGGSELKEERAFAEMVDSYRKKLSTLQL